MPIRMCWSINLFTSLYLPHEPLGQTGIVYQIEALTCYGGKTTYFTCVWTKMLWQEQCCLLDGLSMSVPWRATSWKYRERDGHWPIYQRVKMWKYGSYVGGAASIYQTARRIVSWWTAARWSRFTMLVKILENFDHNLKSKTDARCSRLTPR